MRALLCAALILMLSVPAAAAPGRGPLVSMELRDVELKEVLRAIGQEHSINVIIDEGITGKVTVSLRDVPLWDALDSILLSKGYTYRIQPGGLVIIEPRSDAMRAAEELVVREFRLKYLKLDGPVLAALNGMLTARGKATLIPSTSSVVVKDLPLGIKRVTALIEKLDVMPRQIMIETRIVEVNTSFTRELGVTWGRTGYNSTSSAFGVGSSGTSEARFAVNLPKAGSEGMDLIFGLAVDSFSLNLQLSALEDTGAGKIISKPKILVRENHQAEITSGTEILVPSVANSTAATIVEQAKPRTLEAKLSLVVTPRVAGDDWISLIIDTSREEFDFSRQIQGFPPKLTRTAKTELFVRNGQTVVIGGIYTKNKSTDESGAPLLRKIPILGWLFKKETKQDIQTELLIFITPTIAKEETQEWSQRTP